MKNISFSKIIIINEIITYNEYLCKIHKIMEMFVCKIKPDRTT